MPNYKPHSKTCENCGGPIPSSVVVDGKRRRLHARKFCLVCSPFNARNSRKLDKFKDDGSRECRECGEVKPPKDFPKGRQSGARQCKACFATYMRERRQRFKRACVDYKGGKCQMPDCGYDKCLTSLDFHHPGDKDFNISSRRHDGYLSDAVKAELDRCVLLCKNCHGEVHEGIRQEIVPWALAFGGV